MMTIFNVILFLGIIFLLILCFALMGLLVLLLILVVYLGIKCKSLSCGKGGSMPDDNISEEDLVAYNDSVQAFVNINDYIYGLKRYNSLILPYISWFACGGEKPHVCCDTLSDEERSNIALLVMKIEQFKKNNEPAINNYLRRLGNNGGFFDCLRYPLGKVYDDELDQNLIGADMEPGQKVCFVYKIGYLFPESKNHPYREKSIIR